MNATGHIQTDDERKNDAEQVQRILTQTDEAIAYDHASHGCPFEDEGTCPVCDHEPAVFVALDEPCDHRFDGLKYCGLCGQGRPE